MNYRPLFFMIAMAFVAAACGTSSPVRYFHLEPLDAPSASGRSDQIIIGFGPLELPGYLDRPQIVTKGVNTEVIIDDFRRWSEPLDETINRVVAASVDSLVDEVIVVAYPYNTQVKPEFRVYGDVVRFDADTSGLVVFVVQWGIVTADRETVLPPIRSRYTAQAHAPADTGSVVMALNSVVEDFSREVAQRVRTALSSEQ